MYYVYTQTDQKIEDWTPNSCIIYTPKPIKRLKFEHQTHVLYIHPNRSKDWRLKTNKPALNPDTRRWGCHSHNLSSTYSTKLGAEDLCCWWTQRKEMTSNHWWRRDRKKSVVFSPTKWWLLLLGGKTTWSSLIHPLRGTCQACSHAERSERVELKVNTIH